MATQKFRDVGPIVARIRQALLGRKHKNNLRFQPLLAERPGPEANLPDGVSHKLAFNYYFTRDGRREVAPPKALAGEDTQKAIEAGEGSVAVTAIGKTGKTPGAVFRYSQ